MVAMACAVTEGKDAGPDTMQFSDHRELGENRILRKLLRLILSVVFLAGSSVPAFADVSNQAVHAVSALCDTSHAVAITSATTTELVASDPLGRSVIVCGIFLTISGTNPTAVLKYGTKASSACDTAAVVLTGAMVLTAGVTTFGNGGIAILATPGGQELCLTSGGTPTIEGWIYYTLR